MGLGNRTRLDLGAQWGMRELTQLVPILMVDVRPKMATCKWIWDEPNA
jgi:hypothetical protein